MMALPKKENVSEKKDLYRDHCWLDNVTIPLFFMRSRAGLSTLDPSFLLQISEARKSKCSTVEKREITVGHPGSR